MPPGKRRLDTYRLQYVRKITDQRRRPGCRGGGKPIAGNPVDLIRLLVKPVITQFVPDIQRQQNAARQTDRQPHNVDDRLADAPLQMPDRHGQIVPEHDAPPDAQIYLKQRNLEQVSL